MEKNSIIIIIIIIIISSCYLATEFGIFKKIYRFFSIIISDIYFVLFNKEIEKYAYINEINNVIDYDMIIFNKSTRNTKGMSYDIRGDVPIGNVKYDNLF
jgi:hypothetical protein